MHHYYVPKKAQGHVCKTDAHLQFDNADHIGREAVLETYDRLFNLWKTDSSLIVELKLVLNHRIVFWDEMHRNDRTILNISNLPCYIWICMIRPIII